MKRRYVQKKQEGPTTTEPTKNCGFIMHGHKAFLVSVGTSHLIWPIIAGHGGGSWLNNSWSISFEYIEDAINWIDGKIYFFDTKQELFAWLATDEDLTN